jgi:hypothetical protein
MRVIAKYAFQGDAKIFLPFYSLLTLVFITLHSIILTVVLAQLLSTPPTKFCSTGETQGAGRWLQRVDMVISLEEST